MTHGPGEGVPRRRMFRALGAMVAMAGAAMAGNPTPWIDQPLVPDSAAPGGAGFVLVVNGSGFVAGATVDWNGSALVTTFVSGTQLSAAVPASDIAAAGTAKVVVVNPGPGGGASNAAYFAVTPPSTAFNLVPTAASPIQVAGCCGTALFVATGDFNGDGIPDVAVASDMGTRGVFIYLGDGAGGFTLHQSLTASFNDPTQIVAGAFHNNGIVDLAVVDGVDTLAPSVILLSGDGNGNFTASTPGTVFSGTQIAIGAGDFNEDGNLDLVVDSNNPGGDNILSFVPGNGDGTFGTPINATLSSPVTSGFPSAMAVGDFNGDGKLDVAFTLKTATNNLAVLLGTGSGTFTPAASSLVSLGNTPVALVAGDFNGDGKLDLAAANFGDSSLSVLLGNGNGTFASSAVALGGEPNWVTMGDFNGDGKPDLAVTLFNLPGVVLLAGNGDGGFTALPATGITPSPTGGDEFPTQMASADFDGDGTADIVTADQDDGRISVLLQEPEITLAPNPLAFGDVDVGAQSSTLSVTATNTGSAYLIFGTGAVSISGTNAGDFAIVSDGCSGQKIAPGLTCAVSVAFKPSAVAAESASIGFADNAAGSPQTVGLTGTGTAAPAASLSATGLSFGNEAVGTQSGTQTVIVTNTGGANLIFNAGAVAVSGANASEFPIVSDGCSGQTVLPKGTCAVGVAFKPSVAGSGAAFLNFADNAPNSPQAVSLSGTGTQAAASLSATGLSFGNEAVGTQSGTQTVIVTNTGNANLIFTLGAVTVSGANASEFPIVSDGCSGKTVLPEGTCAVGVAFKPSVAGSAAAFLNFADNAPNSPQAVTLSGVGVGTPTVTTLAVAAASPDVEGSNVTVAATVGAVNSPATNLTGTVTFLDGTTPLGSDIVTGAGIYSLSTPYLAVGPHSITAVYSGDTNFLASQSLAQALTVVNATPAITLLSAPSGPLALGSSGTPVTISWSFSDTAGSMDKHTCSINWDAGGVLAGLNVTTTTAGGVSPDTSGILGTLAPGTCTGAFTYPEAGVYTAVVTISDEDPAGCTPGSAGCGSNTSTYQYVVIYDPNAGFVTGGGWINSPAGADAAQPALAGTAKFGFVSKYLPGSTTPSGNTEFQFQAGGLDFHSTSYQWLSIAAGIAQYTGAGTINGALDSYGKPYQLVLTACDAQVNGACAGTSTDTFRVQISDSAGNAVYDNMMGQPAGAAPVTPLAGGEIVIHTSS